MVQDRQGSVTEILNNSGTVVDHIFYDGYGNETESVPTTHANGYAGYFRDTLTGFLGTQTRWYSPVVGRWISEDCIGFNGGDTHLSRYVGNGPTNGVDPSGRVWVDFKARRINLDHAAFNIGSAKGTSSLRSEFSVAWNVKNQAFVKIVNGKQCKLCDEIGIIQIVRATTHWDSVLANYHPKNYASSNYDWQVDSSLKDGSYSTASSDGGVVRGDPTTIKMISAEDSPEVPTVWPGTATAKYFWQEFETWVVCLAGQEGPKFERSSLTGLKKLKDITVYGGVSWDHEWTRRADGLYDVERTVTHKMLTSLDTDNLKKALSKYFDEWALL